MIAHNVDVPAKLLRRRLQFSLSSLLLFTALVAISISHFQTSRTLRHTESALETARNELGYLTIDEPDNLNVISLPAFDAMQWRWRVHLPSGERFRLRWEIDNIPQSGMPKPPEQPDHSKIANSAFYDRYGKPWVAEAPFILTIAIHKDGSGRWSLTCKTPEGARTTPIKNPPPWLDDGDLHFSWQLAGDQNTRSAEADEPLVLVRYRKAKQVPGRTTVDMQPTAGLMVWIERADSK